MAHRTTPGGGLGRDLRFAWRLTLKHPLFSALIVLSLTLGIGANTAIFSLLHSTLLRPLPVGSPEQLVVLSNPGVSGRWTGSQTGERSLLSFPEYEFLAENTDVFSGLMASQSNSNSLEIRLEGSTAAPERIRTRMVSASYFSVLGVSPLLGRTFSQESREEPWVVLSHSYWQRRFGLDPSVVGRTLLIGDTAFAIVGVMGPEFFGETVSNTPDMWIPLKTQPLILPGRDYLNVRPNPAEKVMFLHVFGRLKPGVDMAAASSQVNVLFDQLLESEAGTALSGESRTRFLNQDIRMREGGRGVSSFRSSFSQPLFILMGGVGLILLLACSNVATLLLARATVRERELGVRLAIGASRRLLVRQMLTESLFLSLSGGLLGIAFSVWAGGALLRMVLPGPSSLAPSWRPDLTVLAFTAAVSVLTGVLFGLVPAYRSLRADVSTALRQGRVAGRAGHQRLGKALVSVQVALSLLLLIGAGLFFSTLANLEQQSLGFDREKLLVMSVDPRPAGYDTERNQLLYRRIQERLEAIPSIQDVTLSDNGLLSGSQTGDRLWVEGFSSPDGENARGANYDHVGPGYFESLRIPIVAGRGILEQDDSGAPYVAVINQAMAKFFFGESDPLGKRIRVVYANESFPDYTIVGVVKDVKANDLREEPSRRFYVSVHQPNHPRDFAYWIVRTRGRTADSAQAMRAAVAEIDPNLKLGTVRQLDELVVSQLGQERLIARLSSAFGIVALLLAAVGLYGLMSYSVARRTNEIGIRMAIGARSRDVAAMVLRESLILTAIGSAVGLPLAYAGSLLISGFLFGVSAQDPLITAVALSLLAFTALSAALVPALRASRVSPLKALRSG